MKKTTVYLDAEAYQELKRLAREQGRAPAALVREAVVEYTVRQRKSRVPRSLGAFRSGRSDLGQRAEDLLDGMGEP